MRFTSRLSYSILALAALATGAGCSESSSPDQKVTRFYGDWVKAGATLPPVSLTVREDGSAVVGVLSLSGVRTTLPARFTDSSVVLAEPSSSKRAPFVGVMLSDGTLRATLSGEPDVVVTLQRVK